MQDILELLCKESTYESTGLTWYMYYLKKIRNCFLYTPSKTVMECEKYVGIAEVTRAEADFSLVSFEEQRAKKRLFTKEKHSENLSVSSTERGNWKRQKVM